MHAAYRISRARIRRKEPVRILPAITIALIAVPWQIAFLLISPAPAAADEAPRVLIEEVAWAGSSASTADEWIELANTGNTTATVGGWSLHGTGTGGKTIFFPPDAEIPPRGTYLISNYAETDSNSVLASTVQLATTTVSLSNSAFGIEVRDAADAIIDRAGDGTAPFAGSANPYASMVRVSDAASGDMKDAWETASSSQGFKEGSPDFGTPGFCDLCRTEAIAENKTPQPIEASEPEATATSTNVIVSSNVETTSTEPFTDIGYGTSTEQNAVETSATSTESAISEASSTESLVPADPLEIALNEVMSHPASGSEWVELTLPMDATATDRLLLFYDGQGRIATVSTGTPVTAPGYLVVTLATAKLNNSGDAVSVRESDGRIIASASFGALDAGVSWARNLDDADDVWTATTMPTPGAPNVFPLPETTAPTQTRSVFHAVSNTATSTTPVTSNVTTTIVAASANDPFMITFSEIFSNPATGTEWIELALPITASATDRELLVRTSKTTVAKIPRATPASAPGFLLIRLASTKLANNGGEINLVESNGMSIEHVAFPKLEKGTAWAKNIDGIWTETETPTPAETNRFETIADEEATPTPIEKNTERETETTSSTTKTKLKKTKSDTKKTTSAVTASTKISFDMMYDQTLNNVRARVTGVAGSPAKLLGASANKFVLLSEDGRGLLVSLPAHLHIPPYGSTIRVQGTLKSTANGPQLTVGANDVWISVASSTPPIPRTVDLLVPAEEDGWSLTSAEGAVTAVNATSFSIEADDGTAITVSAPPVIGFRTKRLAKGDRVRVVGFADPRKTTPTILARNGEEITILEHASGTVSAVSSTGAGGGTQGHFPDWAPFGAAGGAIVATGAGKRFRELWKQRKLKILAGK